MSFDPPAHDEPAKSGFGRVLKGCGIAALVAVLALGGIAYCGYSMYSRMTAEMPLADKAALDWLALYNASDFAGCHRTADATMQTDEPGFIAKLTALRAQTGFITLGERTGFNMNTFNGDTTMRYQWQATGERGAVTVVMTLHQAQGWKVSGFQVASTL